jgi:hypothetical protein
MTRPLCPICKQRPREINCRRNGKYYYLKMCAACNAKKRQLPVAVPKWSQSGYKKKTVCDRCGFRSRWAAQLLVFHIDGNLNNTNINNLKTICQNCVIDVAKSDLPWRLGDLSPDI